MVRKNSDHDDGKKNSPKVCASLAGRVRNDETRSPACCASDERDGGMGSGLCVTSWEKRLPSSCSAEGWCRVFFLRFFLFFIL